MKIIIRKSVAEEIMRTLGKSHYIKRWKSNGKWAYKYPSSQPKTSRTDIKRRIALKTKLIEGIKPFISISEKEIDEAIIKLSLYASDGRLKCKVE